MQTVACPVKRGALHLPAVEMSYDASGVIDNRQPPTIKLPPCRALVVLLNSVPYPHKVGLQVRSGDAFLIYGSMAT